MFWVFFVFGETMKALNIFHFGDCHYSQQNLEESDRCVGHLVECAQNEIPDVIALTGDSTDHRLEAHSSALRALALRIKQCSEIAPTILLQGTYSHEPPGTIEMFGLLSGKYPIAIANRICQIALTDKSTWLYSDGPLFREDEIELKNIKGVFTCVPTLNKASVAAALGAHEAAEEMGIQIQRYLKGAAVMNIYFQNNGIPTIGLSHGTVHGCVTEHGVPMMGNDHEFTQEALFDAQCSAFMLSHIHKHQYWEKDQRLIAYAGSIGRFHYGEMGDKGFLKWTVGVESASFVLVVTPSRVLMHFDYDGVPDMCELTEASKHCLGANVRVRWQIDQEHSQIVNREQIIGIFKEANEIKIEVRILPIQRTRCEGINAEISTAGKLKRWCNLTEVEPEPLVERLEVLSLMSSIEIASNIIRDISNFENDMKLAMS